MFTIWRDYILGKLFRVKKVTLSGFKIRILTIFCKIIWTFSNYMCFQVLKKHFSNYLLITFQIHYCQYQFLWVFYHNKTLASVNIQRDLKQIWAKCGYSVWNCFQFFGMSCCMFPLPWGVKRMKMKHVLGFSMMWSLFKSVSLCSLLHSDQFMKEEDETITL